MERSDTEMSATRKRIQKICDLLLRLICKRKKKDRESNADDS